MAEASGTQDTASDSSKEFDLNYGLEEVPPLGEGLLLGLQHYLTMLGSTIVIPIILTEALGFEHGSVNQALLISTMFLCSGIATLLQTTFGNRLPIVQGGTFSFLAPTFAITGSAAIGGDLPILHVQGAIILGSFVQMAIGYSGGVGWIKQYIGPITVAPTIGLIGLALFSIGAPQAGQHWVLGGLTIAAIVICAYYLESAHRIFDLYPIIIGLVFVWIWATLGSHLFGVYPEGHPAYVDFSAVWDSPTAYAPHPFQWGVPQFGLAAFLGMLAGVFASIIESIGDYYAVARLSNIPNPDKSVFNKGIGMEGVGTFVAGVFGTGNGTTSYSENVGAVGITKVASRRVVQYGAGIMLILGFFPKFAALFTSLPDPIVGGLYCVMFGIISGIGISNLQFIDMNSMRNLFIVGFAFFMGLSVPEYFNGLEAGDIDVPMWLSYLDQIGAGGEGPGWLGQMIRILGKTGMAVGAILAFFFDNTIPGDREERGLHVWSEAPESIG